jgi:BASS family bile acid:Na+ symporter
MQNLFSDTLLPLALAIITLGMGLSIDIKDFKNIFLYPKAVIIGISCQLILLPLIAFGIATMAKIDPVYKVGLIIISACPGGASSNLITFMLAGNVALSISMTVINSLITLITIPLIVSAGVITFLDEHTLIRLPVSETIINIFLITLVPAFIGILLRRYFTLIAEKLKKPLQYLLPMILLGIYSGVIFIEEGEESSQMLENMDLFIYALLLNILAMISGWAIAKLFRLGRRNQFTISVEVGLQNSALAIFVASSILHSQSMALVAVVYGSFSFFSTALFGWGVKRVSR